jgi:hypothetical protein
VSRLVPGALLLAASSAMVCADEVRVRDLRLAIGVTPPLTSVKQETGSSGVDQRLDLGDERGVMVSLGYHGGTFRDHGGFAWGVGLDSFRGEYASPNGFGDDAYAAYGVYGSFGWGYGFTETIHLELAGRIASGYAQADWTSPTGEERNDGGLWGALGFRVGTFWEVTRHLVIGVQGEYSRLAIAFQNVDAGGVSQFALAGDGLSGQAVLAVRF